MNLDIHSAVQTAFLIALIGIFLTAWIGVRTIRSGRRLPFFRKRRDRMVRGWRMVFSAAGLVLIAFFLNRFAEPVIYHFYPPTPTITTTPTASLTPTITPTPTVTLTPTITPTTSITPTPLIPEEIATTFIGQVTPNPDSVFSPLQFALKMDDKHLPVDPATEFKNPVGHVYAVFSYDKLIDGAQWTALWYRNGELVFYETTPWDGGSGGLGYTDWNPAPEEWYAGDYAVYIFLGTEYRVGGYFTVTGNPPGGGPTRTPTKSPTAKFSPTPSLTPTPRSTATSSFTPTETLTRTPRPTATATRTPPPTSTQRPTLTPRPTITRLPTATVKSTQKPNSAR